MIAIKASLVIGLACAIAASMRGRSAASRHALLTIAVGCAAALPAIERIAPGWGQLTLPAAASLTAAAPQPDVLRAVWLGGASIGLMVLLAGVVASLRRGSRARPATDSVWIAVLGEVADEMAIGRTVRLLESNATLMPVTWGILRPSVLLPIEARDWPADRIRAVLQHELAHVRRGDWLINLAVDIVARLFWFSPVVWIARRQIRIECERACDDAVLNLGVDGAEYATHLIDVARGFRRSRLADAVLPAMAGRGRLERRVAAALNAEVSRTPLSALALAGIAIAVLILTIPVAGFGLPPGSPAGAPLLLDVQREIMMRFGGEERRFSLVTRDVSFWSNRIEGRVELRAHLMVDGSLSGLRLVEPVHPDLASAAETIVRQWRREPVRVRGIPVEIPIRMTVDFRR
jgi:TonB family protein